MASVNGGFYPCLKHNWFLHCFAGPGLSVETTLQTRLLIGGGVGFGEANRFSINGGIAIGNVKRLSNAFDQKASYTVPQTDIYYSTMAVKPFIAINYVFGLQ